jgi:hypothetical protein
MTTMRTPKHREVPPPFRDQDYHEAAKLPQLHIDDELIVEYAVSAPCTMGDVEPELDEVGHSLRKQTCTAWVFLKGVSVGGVILKRYMLPMGIDNEEFIYLMDLDEAAEHELSIALTSQFEDLGADVAACGDILEINRIWLASLPQTAGKSPTIVKALASAFCPQFSVLVLKAFPLEYEGALGTTGAIEEPGQADEAAFRRRQLAMMRYYARQFGVRQMLSVHGDKGWMFRLRSDLEDLLEE